MADRQENIAGRPDRATIILDEEGVVAAWDRIAEQQLGYSAEEIVGQHFLTLASREMVILPSLRQITEHSRSFGQYARYHIVGTKSGRYFLAEIKAQVEYGANRERLTFVWITPVIR